MSWPDDAKIFMWTFVLGAILGLLTIYGCGGSTGSATEATTLEEQSIEQLQEQPTDSSAERPLVPETRARTRPENAQHTPRVTNVVDTDRAEDANTRASCLEQDKICPNEHCETGSAAKGIPCRETP